MMVVKLPVDEFDQPQFKHVHPQKFDINKMVRWGEGNFDVPYIAAEFAVDDIPFSFTLGDKGYYNGYKNGQLESDSYYGVFMAGVILGKHGEAILVESDWVDDSHTPGVPAWFRTAPSSNLMSEQAFLLCCIAGVLAVMLLILAKLG